jgi:hypothetical protein
MPKRLANKPHTSGTKLNSIRNLHSTTIKAAVQKLHQVLMVIQPKNLILSVQSLMASPKKKNIQTIVVLSCEDIFTTKSRWVDNLFCNLDFINDNVEKQCLSSTLPIFIITNSFAKAHILTIDVARRCWMQV